MSFWERSPRRLLCGKCAGPILIGDPMLVYANAEHAWRKVRCRSCAGEPVPEDLAVLEIRTSVPITPMRKLPKVARVGELARDWKISQSGEDLE